MNKKLIDRPDFTTFFWCAYSGFFQIKRDIYIQCSKTGDTYSISYKKYNFLWFIWIILHIVSNICCYAGVVATVFHIRETAGSVPTGVLIGIVVGFVLVEYLIILAFFVIYYFNIQFERVQEQITNREDYCKLTDTEDESISE